MGSKTETYQKVSTDRQESLKNAVDILDGNKKAAIAAALENPGLCGIIALAILVSVIVVPGAGVLVLFA